MNFITKDVLYNSGDIKREAKAQLKGNWRSAIILVLIPTAFAAIFIGNTAQNTYNQSFGADLLDIILNFIHTFLLVGVNFTFLDFLRRHEEYIDPIRGVIQGFKKEYFGNLFLLKITKYFFIFLWTLLFIIPGIVKAIAYSQAEFIYKDTVDRTGEQPSPRECLKESQRLMKGHKMDLFVLDLSFIGWHILALFTFGILYIWLLPYLTFSQVVFYENIAGEDYLGTPEPIPPYENDEDYQTKMEEPYEEVGKDPDDFRDFEDF